MKKVILFFLALNVVIAANTQTKMRIDRIDATSSSSNTFNFLNYGVVKEIIVQHIGNAVKKYWNLETVDTDNININFKRKANGSTSNETINASLVHPEFEGWHLSIQFNENLPNYVLKILGSTEDAFELIPVTTAVIDVQLVLKDNVGNVQHKSNAYFIVKANNKNAFGNPDWSYSLSPTAFTSFTKHAATILLDSSTTALPINLVTGGAAFFADNYIMPAITNQPRIFTEQQKDFIKYTYADSSKTLLRFVEPMIYVLNLKKKTDAEYPQQFAAAIKHRKENVNYKYCMAEQAFRSVFTNNNYTCKTFVAINNDVFNVPQYAYRYLPGNIHFLLSDTDTLATFSIDHNILATGKEIYFNKIYNGIDSSFQLIQQAVVPKRTVQYDLQMSGTFKNKPFEILCSAGNTIKEIYYNNKLVCITRGQFMPEAFILLDTNLPTNIFEPLLMLAFFKTP